MGTFRVRDEGPTLKLVLFKRGAVGLGYVLVLGLEVLGHGLVGGKCVGLYILLERLNKITRKYNTSRDWMNSVELPFPASGSAVFGFWL